MMLLKNAADCSKTHRKTGALQSTISQSTLCCICTVTLVLDLSICMVAYHQESKHNLNLNKLTLEDYLGYDENQFLILLDIAGLVQSLIDAFQLKIQMMSNNVKHAQTCGLKQSVAKKSKNTFLVLRASQGWLPESIKKEIDQILKATHVHVEAYHGG